MEAANLLRAAREGEENILAHEAEGRAELSRREEVLVAARRENSILAHALAYPHPSDCPSKRIKPIPRGPSDPRHSCSLLTGSPRLGGKPSGPRMSPANLPHSPFNLIKSNKLTA